jgi:HSP20 family protein
MANTKNKKTSKKDQRSNETKQQSSQALLATVKGERSRADIARGEDYASATATPFTFMRRFSEQMDRLFEDFGLGHGLLAPTFESGLDRLSALGNTAWSPQVEVFERNNQLVVRADLPGMAKDDVSVEVTDDALIIRGERKSEREEEAEGYYRSERSYGSVYRRIPLPKGIKAENATADFRNGVLEIKLPAVERVEQSPRQLEIRGQAESQEQPRAKAKAAGQRF